MNIKKREAVALYNFLNDMQSEEVTLGISDWKSLSDNKELIEVELKELDDSRMKLVREYSSADKDAELIKVDDDKRDVFSKFYLELLEEEIDLELKTISPESIGEQMKGAVGIWEFVKFMVKK